MFGPGGIGDGINTETGEGSEECGVIPRAFVELFRLAKDREEQYKYSFVVSMYELYCDGLRDLLNKKKDPPKLVIKLGNSNTKGMVKVEGATELQVNSLADMVLFHCTFLIPIAIA
eukprot:438407_1